MKLFVYFLQVIQRRVEGSPLVKPVSCVLITVKDWEKQTTFIQDNVR